MKNEIKEISWTLKNGMAAKAVVEHVLEKEINLDGHVNVVKDDRVCVTLVIPGMGIAERDCRLNTNVTPMVRESGATATIRTAKGVVGIVDSARQEIAAAIESFKAPTKELLPEIKRGFGWCEKCQSYCFGDCEA